MTRVEWHGDMVKGRVQAGAARGIRDGLEAIKDASLQIVPRETTTLAASAGTSVGASGMVGSVYYDDPRDVKTIKQHEDLTYRHPPGESAKFLERPMRSAKGPAAEALAAALRSWLGG